MIIGVERKVKMTWAEYTKSNDDGVYSIEFGGKEYNLRYPIFQVNSIYGEIANVTITGNIHVT